MRVEVLIVLRIQLQHLDISFSSSSPTQHKTMTLNYFHSSNTRSSGKSILSKPNSIYHEPSTRFYRAWSNPLPSEHISHTYPSLKAPVPKEPPVLKSGRSSLLFETDENGKQTSGLGFLLCDVPIHPKHGSKDEKLLKALRDEDGRRIQEGLNEKYYFKPSHGLNDDGEEKQGFGKMGSTFYDLVVKSEGKETVVLKKAGWTYDQDKVEDLSSPEVYPETSLLGNAR